MQINKISIQVLADFCTWYIITGKLLSCISTLVIQRFTLWALKEGSIAGRTKGWRVLGSARVDSVALVQEIKVQVIGVVVCHIAIINTSYM